MIPLLLLIYLIGMIVTTIMVAEYFTAIRHLKKFKNIDLFSLRPDFRPYLIRKILFWPFYLLTEKNPITLLSEIFFNRYGNAGHIYLGADGIKNFFWDILKGKNRYKNYQIKVFVVPVDKDSSFYEEIFPLSKINSQLYARITCAKHNLRDRYLLNILLTTDPAAKQSNSQSITRYDLDRCESVNFQELKSRLSKISSSAAEAVLQTMQKENMTI